MRDTELAQLAVREGLLSSNELDRVRRQVQSTQEPLLAALLEAGLLRNSDIDRIRREWDPPAPPPGHYAAGRPGSGPPGSGAPGHGTSRYNTTRIAGEIATTTHQRLTPDEVRNAGSRPENEFGRYTLVEKIGSGGMGSIWKAWDNTLGRWCALKLLHEEHAVHEDHRERFLREARAAARLAHPNIVQVHEVGQLETTCFIALEYIPGETLRQRIASRSTGPELRRRIELVRQAAEGLASAHEAGITHRDMKPENVLVMPTPKGGQAKVTDFGLAVDKTVVTRLTVAGDVFGTPAYMSPEQALGLQEIVGPPADVFATGCILYEIVTGKLPFDNDQAAASVYATIHTDPVSVRKLEPRAHPDLETVIMHCLEKDPQKRYRTARELADDLGRYMAGEPIVAKPPTRFGRLKRKMVQNLGATIGIALAVLVGFVFLGVMFYRIQAESEDIARELAEGAELEAQAVSSPELLRLALARYQSVAKRDPNNPQAVEGLARVAKAIQAFGDGGLEQAVERDIRVALEVIRDPARVGAASVVCDLLIAHYGSHHRARAARAEWRWRTGDPEGAMADLEALPPSPGTTAMRRLRVLCLVASDRAVDAEVVAGDPGPGPISPVEMAAARLAQGNRAECRQWLQQVLSPTAESYWVTALLEVREQGYRAAIASFDACSALDPTFIPARLAAIRGLREGGRHAEAVDRAAKIVEMLPRLPAPRISLAASYAAGGNTVAACREMDRVLRMADAPAWRVMRGTWLLQSGDPRGVADLARLAR